MKDFVDLTGASGTTYRFRRAPDGQPHVPIAGNYAWLRAERDGVRVVALGVTSDLSRPAEAPPEGARDAGLYTRLNVARAVREAEHVDLAASYGQARAAVPA